MLAAAIDGHSSGSTTSRSAPSGVAPRSSALCSISGLMLASRLRTTTVTNGMQNPIIASSIVRLPSATPSSVNSSSVATAVAVSGATSRTRIVPSTGLVIRRGAALQPQGEQRSRHRADERGDHGDLDAHPHGVVPVGARRARAGTSGC